MSSKSEAGEAGAGLFGLWSRTPLYLRILVGLVLGVIVGMAFGPRAEKLDIPARLVLRALGALAPPIVLVAVVNALLKADVKGGLALRMAGLLSLNTLVAIVVGLGVANVVAPGLRAQLSRPDKPPSLPKGDVVQQILDNVPGSLLKPLVDNQVIGVVLVAVAVGVAGRSLVGERRRLLEDGVSIAFELVIRVLHWVIALVPLAVFGKIASIVGKSGFEPFKALAAFVVAVLLALTIQSIYYLVRIRLFSWVRPRALLAGMRDALVMAFSTASSTATMPVTYDRLKRLGVRERSASLGALVGANFNNDGTALYEAMSALFIAQLIGHDLSLVDQVLIVLTSVVASVGAAGIPEAGLVTMTLVFTAVRLPTEYIALLLTVDWFLDRCRTTINVLGDVNVACILDGRVKEEPPAEARAAPEL
ncbi:MAG: dicarboxylate/amino acid:cation symporter [Polyangiaceae bacterium]|jgi:Na+/H+-dicarboxylate symporter|nr:dicarboxylate/amino acid:cation symporter [Polyangiaceae bacterium]